MFSNSPRAISIVNRSGHRSPSALIKKSVTAVLDQHQARPGEVAILLTGDEEMRDLNCRFRQLDESTDVLTFPAENPMLLGDIAISLPYAKRQARARKVGISQELAYLSIHGALHLLGFCDETEDDKRVMIEQMNLAASSAGLKPDYEWSSLLHGDSV